MSNVVKAVLKIDDKGSATLKAVSGAAEDAADNAQTASTKYTELASKFHLAGLAASAARKSIAAILGPLRKIGSEGIAAGAQMEGFETRLTVLMGSAGDARKRLDELFKIGTTTPFELPGLIEAEVNLRALGVNAEKTLPLVMDFAGAMGTDLASAAVEVGRAMQFGAGAVETISGRALRAQVELRTGASALKMETEEFREAMITTLTDPDGIFAGGTEKLAATFDGMLSNMKDAFFKFSKDVGDAGLFDVAKETLRGMLELLDKNRDSLVILSRVLADGLARGLLGSVKLAGFLLDTFIALGAAIVDISRSWTGFVVNIAEATLAVPGLRKLGPSKEELNALKDRQRTLEDTKEELIAMGGFATIAEDLVAKIQNRVAKLPKRVLGGGGRGAPPPPVQQKPEDDSKPDDVEKASEAVEVIISDLEKGLIMGADAIQAAAGGASSMLGAAGAAAGGVAGPIVGAVQGLAALGQKGAAAFRKDLRAFIRNAIKGLVEVLPAIIGEVPLALIDALPDLILGVLRALPRILRRLFLELPVQIAKGAFQALGRIWKTIRRWFKNALEKLSPKGLVKGIGRGFKSIGKGLGKVLGFQTGGYVPTDGIFRLHAGERIVPATGASTGTMEAASNIGAGQTINIHTNVVDPNAIDQLGRQLDRQFGSRGRSFGVDLFSRLEARAGRV